MPKKNSLTPSESRLLGRLTATLQHASDLAGQLLVTEPHREEAIPGVKDIIGAEWMARLLADTLDGLSDANARTESGAYHKALRNTNHPKGASGDGKAK
jgi:hypothetical protein